MSIVFENVTKTYDSTVLDNVTLNFKEGKINALLGTSGRGKTTVLRILAELEKTDGGSVKTDGKVGYLFQEHRLLPNVTAFENVRLACDSDEKAKNALEVCCAAALSEKTPEEMSGGERQRVSLARLVAFGGDIWLMDEPFSALDADTKERVISNLMPFMREKTVVLVTHSEDEAAFADNVIKM